MKRSGFKKPSYPEYIAKLEAKRVNQSSLSRKTPLQRAQKPLGRKKVKKPKITSLKKKLDAIFSKYIRQKYSKDGYGSCYTCGARKDVKQLQCGHFISRSYLATRFSEDNVRPQCVGCNVFGGGKTVEFAANFRRDYGETHVEKLYQEARQIVRDYPYQEKIDYYTNLLNEPDA